MESENADEPGQTIVDKISDVGFTDGIEINPPPLKSSTIESQHNDNMR